MQRYGDFWHETSFLIDFVSGCCDTATYLWQKRKTDKILSQNAVERTKILFL